MLVLNMTGEATTEAAPWVVRTMFKKVTYYSAMRLSSYTSVATRILVGECSKSVMD